MERKMTYLEVPKRTKSAIKTRINATVKKYGYEVFRMVANRYINDRRDKEKLEKEIAEKEAELKKLKRK